MGYDEYTDVGNPTASQDNLELVRWTHDQTKPTITLITYNASDTANSSSITHEKDTNDATFRLVFEVSEPTTTSFLPSHFELLNLSANDDNLSVWDVETSTNQDAYAGSDVNKQTYVKTFKPKIQTTFARILPAGVLTDSAATRTIGQRSLTSCTTGSVPWSRFAATP